MHLGYTFLGAPVSTAVCHLCASFFSLALRRLTQLTLSSPILLSSHSGILARWRGALPTSKKRSANGVCRPPSVASATAGPVARSLLGRPRTYLLPNCCCNSGLSLWNRRRIMSMLEQQAHAADSRNIDIWLAQHIEGRCAHTHLPPQSSIPPPGLSLTPSRPVTHFKATTSRWKA